MELIAKVAGGALVRDLLLLPPHGAIDRRNRVKIADAPSGEIATIEAEVDQHFPGFRNAPYRVRLRDETGFLTVAYFRAKPDMLQRMWPIGQTRLLSGKVEIFNGERQMLHPDHVVDPEKGDSLPNVEPVYPLTAGLFGRTVVKAMDLALQSVPDAPEWLLETTVSAHEWPGFSEALKRLHHPETPDEVSPEHKARQRLAYDELFARQCALRLRRQKRKEGEGRVISGDGGLAQKILAALPYAPTAAQKRAVAEILRTWGSPRRCFACCRAMLVRARLWWRRSPWLGPVRLVCKARF